MNLPSQPGHELEQDSELEVSLQEVVSQFATGAARPEELPGLSELTRQVASAAPLDQIRAQFQRLSFDGYLRGALAAVAQAMLASPRPDLALLLARELVDAVDPPLGLKIARGALTVPEVVAGRREISSVYVQLNMLLAEAMLRRDRVGEARRHFEAILSLDIDHPRALQGWADCVAKLEAQGMETRHRSRGLALLDGLEDVELDRSLAADRYELGRPLGRGRHAVVYEAFDRRVGRQVALKRLLGPRAGGDRTTARLVEARFFAEARTLARVRSPHVIALLDAHPADRFIALDLCRGGNLRLALRRGQVGPDDVPRVASQLSAALTAVHAIGAVHRDVKPANILVRETHADSPIALADFGLALPSTPKQGAARAGTLRYLAPEVRAGAPASPASDRFSAGLVLLEIALAPRPFPAELDVLDAGTRAAEYVPADLEKTWRDLLVRLLDPDPQTRRWP